MTKKLSQIEEEEEAISNIDAAGKSYITKKELFMQTGINNNKNFEESDIEKIEKNKEENTKAPIMQIGDISAYRPQYEKFGTYNQSQFNTNNINGKNFHMFATNRIKDPNGFMSEIRPSNRKLEFDNSLEDINETNKDESSINGTLKNNFISNVSKNNLGNFNNNLSFKNDSRMQTKKFSTAGPGQLNFLSFKDQNSRMNSLEGRNKNKFGLNEKNFINLKTKNNDTMNSNKLDNQSEFESRHETQSIQIQNNYTKIVINVNNQEEAEQKLLSGTYLKNNILFIQS